MQGTGVRHKTRKLVRSVFVQLVHVQYVVPPVPGEHPLFYALQLAYKTTKKTGEFVLPGFGKLVKQKRKARTGFNPKDQDSGQNRAQIPSRQSGKGHSSRSKKVVRQSNITRSLGRSDAGSLSTQVRQRFKCLRLSFVSALHEGVPRAMDHHSSGCYPRRNFPHPHLSAGSGTSNSFRFPSSVSPRCGVMLLRKNHRLPKNNAPILNSCNAHLNNPSRHGRFCSCSFCSRPESDSQPESGCGSFPGQKTCEKVNDCGEPDAGP